jgi:hypothetical protein
MTQRQNVRMPAVAGQFYPDDPKALTADIERYVDKKAVRTDVIGCVLPHAGYMYSGPVAGYTVSRVTVKDTVVLLGPNHTGNGTPMSVMSRGSWKTPLGNVPVQEKLAADILAGSGQFHDDALAHSLEHSLEVELPFLQYFKKDFSIVPIAIANDSIAGLKEAGKALAAAVKKNAGTAGTLLVASSDMTHYEEASTAAKKDDLAIEAILALDEDKPMRTIKEFDISMCGYMPVCVMIVAAKVLGAKKGTLLKYQTSGDITGDRSSVVGYAGITIQ